MTAFPLSPTRTAGRWVAVSGQLGLRAGRLVDGGFVAQAEQAIANFIAVLEQAGLQASSVVKTTVYLADMDDMDALNTVYRAHFSEPFGARTTVQVARLPLDALVEIEGWAFSG